MCPKLLCFWLFVWLPLIITSLSELVCAARGTSKCTDRAAATAFQEEDSLLRPRRSLHHLDVECEAHRTGYTLLIPRHVLEESETVLGLFL